MGGKIKMKIGRILKIIAFTIIFFILQSCVKIETSMNVNSDLSGTSSSEVSIMKNLMPEEELKKEIEKLGIKKFEFEKIESDDNTVDKYNIKLEWRTEEELEKILSFINTGMTMSEVNSPITSPLTENKEKSKNNTENIENQKKDESKTVEIETKDENNDKNKKHVDKNGKENVEKKIFTKEHGVVTVNMGVVKINKLVVKVDGKIIPDSVQEGIVSDSKNEITFYEGDKVNFKYKNNSLLLPILIGAGIAVLIIGIGAAIFASKRKKKSDEEEEYDEFAEDIKHEMERKKSADNNEKTEENLNEPSAEVTEISEDNGIKSENDSNEKEEISGENI
jgi:hypothetical protein